MKQKVEFVIIPKGTKIQFMGKNTRMYEGITNKKYDAWQLARDRENIDFQEPPKMIPEKLKKIEPGNYVLCSKYYIIKIIEGYKKIDDASYFKGKGIYVRNSIGEKWYKSGNKDILNNVKLFHNKKITKVFRNEQKLLEYIMLDSI